MKYWRYRLLYWKRRALGPGRPGGHLSPRRLPPPERRLRALRRRERARPLLVFAAIVALALVLSWLLGALGGPVGLPGGAL